MRPLVDDDHQEGATHFKIFAKTFNDKKTESDELQDIIRLIDNIRNGQAEPSQELSIVSRTLQLIRLIKTQREEANITELAFLLQACRGKFSDSNWFHFRWFFIMVSRS